MYSVEPCLKYFLIQTVSSAIFICSILRSDRLNILVLFRLLIKLGVWPAYIWFINVCLKLNWVNFFFLLRIQKITGLYIYSCCLKNIFIFTVIFINIFWGLLSSLNQTNLRLIFCFISIVHQSWIIIRCIYSIFLIFNYFFFYTLIILTPTFYLNKYDISGLNKRLSLILILSLNLNLIIRLISIRGIPPFNGFFIKLYTLLCLFKYNPDFYLICFFLLFSSLISVYVYTRLIYVILIKINFNNFLAKGEKAFIFFNFFFNITPLFIFFF